MFSSELLPGVLAAAPDAIVVVDGEGRVRYANRQVLTLFGYTPAELTGQQVELLLPDALRARHVSHRHNFMLNQRVRSMGAGLPLFARRKDGSEFPVEISLSPIGADGELYVAAAIRDVTERKIVEDALREARSDADRANRAKSRFLATASHDLRQPLQTLSLLHGTLRRAGLDPVAAEAVEQQGQAIAAMSRLLNALLDISKLESGAVKVQQTEFDVGALLDGFRSEFEILAREKGLVFELQSASLFARTDRTLVSQALRNLIANAIKYTDAGWVRLACQRGDEGIEIEVADSGIGIAPENLSAIFDEFFQVGGGSAASSARGGYGLGLSIVQRIAQLLDLGLTVESRWGTGTRFRLRLPECPAPARAAAPEPVRADGQRAGSSGRILLVEDDASVRKATQVFLRSEGFRVTAAANLDEALDRCDSLGGVDLVITDYHLEGHRGTAVLAALRERLGGELRSIIMTGDTSSAVRELPENPHLRVISKPVDPDELLDHIRTLVVP